MKASERIAMRFNALPRPASNAPLRRIWRVFIWIFWITYFAFVAAVLALRYNILPNIETHRPAIEKMISEALGQQVKIGRIEASWDGINPDLSLFDVQIIDQHNLPAVSFSRVEAILSWRSVPALSLRLNLLQIDQPTLNLRRDREGKFYVAGIAVETDTQNSGSADWIFAQRRIRIHDATLIWNDELRQAPELVLKEFNFGLDNYGRRHRFGLTALPQEAYAAMIDVRGDFKGNNIETMERWSGQAYVEISKADLAIWKQWVDYPLALSQGKGAVRTWIDVKEGKLYKATTDVAVQDVQLRATPDLPELNIDRMSGRLALQLDKDAFILDGTDLEMMAYGATDKERGKPLSIDKTDFHLALTTQNKEKSGQVTVDQIDVGVLVDLASYLPLDEATKKKLDDFAPSGKLNAVKGNWAMDGERLQKYSASGKFSGLTLKANAPFPGFSGLAGSIATDQESGEIILDAKKSSIDLPEVFSDPTIEFDALEAHVKWKTVGDKTDVKLIKARFESPDAAGQAQGTYEYRGEGAGNIDMIASLSRADARAVWRYMPSVVSKDARLWLKDALLAGKSTEAKLTLKGDLDHFPFIEENRDKGQFLVTVKAEDVTLFYGAGWPKITGIYGDLRFEGAGMSIEARQGNILNTKLSKTRVEIPDFDVNTPVLHVQGQVAGATSEFLKFIAQSPVAEKIDHFTDDIRAKGNGDLDLALNIPLDEKELHKAKIKGTFRLTNNEVTFDPAFPPIKQANGTFTFTGEEMNIPRIDGTLLGGTLTIKGGTQKDASTLISVNGQMKMADIKREFTLPALNHLSGETAYQGEITINKRNADLKISSDLKGIASTLPAPFAKPIDGLLSARFEKKLLPKAADTDSKNIIRDQIDLALGENLLSARVIRRKKESGFELERGALAIGGELTLPETGLSVGVKTQSLDLDEWANIFNISLNNDKDTDVIPQTLLKNIRLNTPSLVLQGIHYTDVNLSAANESGIWKINLASQQVSGNVRWDGKDRGKLSGHLERMVIEPTAVASKIDTEETVERLPAIDLIIDDFSVGVNQFGRVELQAHNEKRAWRIDKIVATNPHGKLAGSGFWYADKNRNRTQLDVRIESSNVGKLLERFGHPQAISGGTALLDGQVSWNGTPLSIDYASLSGTLDLSASKGQFVKVNPGVGKLLGLLSLQGLARRVTFDFKDVLTEGMAFDRITAKLDIQGGIMRTDMLEIRAPAAKILMHGQVDIKNETQNLDVIIQPEVGGMAAIGVAIGINPLLGAFTWAASKLLQDPLNQILAYGYRVTGTWDDPKVERITANNGAGSTPETTQPSILPPPPQTTP